MTEKERDSLLISMCKTINVIQIDISGMKTDISELLGGKGYIKGN